MHGRNSDASPGLRCNVLALLIYAYDCILKRTPGPLAMGGCRFLNVLLGMSASPQPWTAANYLVAAGIGIYIVGITWFAAEKQRRVQKVICSAV